jgi:urease accessory protein
MLRAREVRRAGSWQGEPADRVVLPYDARHRRRRAIRTPRGLEFLLDLAEATLLREGDALPLDDGRLVLVEAADEPVLEITAPDAALLMRLAWHLGNRHLPTEVHADRLVILRDHVIAGMVHALGGTATERMRPFNPEGGAYAHGH